MAQINKNLKLICIRNGDALLPVYAQYVNEDIYYVNLAFADNKNLYEGKELKNDFPCLLIEAHTGLIVAQGLGKYSLIKAYEHEYKRKLAQFKKKNKKYYSKLCADYLEMLIQFNKKYGENS